MGGSNEGGEPPDGDTAQASGLGAVQSVQAPPPAVDDALALLADRRRRYALYHLCDRRRGDGAVVVGLSDLARAVAAAERDTDPERLLEDEYERVYLGLQHNHVPRLADAGVVDFEEDRRRVQFDGVEPPLATVLAVARRVEADGPSGRG